MDKKPNKGMKRPSMRMASIVNFIWVALLIAIIGWGGLTWEGGGEPIESDWPAITQMVANGDVEQINIVNKEIAEVKLTEKAIEEYSQQEEYKKFPSHSDFQFYCTIPSVDAVREDLAEIQQQNGTDTPVKYEIRSNRWMNIIGSLIPWILIIGFWVFMMRSARGGGGGNVMNVGKARAQVYDKDNTANRVTFKDVAGLEEAKQEIMEIVDFLRRPQKYRELGGKIPKGALLAGPPGTGKTMLAKAVAGEANVPFLSISGSDFVEMFVGVGASRVRDLFQQAKEKAPCIVFIDEIDAIGRARGKNAGFSGNDERENTLNQILTEMDGFATNSGVIVLAATNRADILDKALMRAGRFDRQIEVGLPDVKEREAIFGVHTRKLRCAPDISHEFLAKQTAGFSGADIANVCNEAALIAARHDKKQITKEEFLAAIDRIVGGLEKKNTVMTAKERYATAIHEAGHAAVMWMLPESDPVVKVTIIPRGRSLGATWYLPEERVHVTSGNLRQRMSGMVAGRVAEQIFLGTIGTGALNDLERTSNMAYAMVAYYGMSERVGNVSYFDSTGQRDAFTKPFSEQTAREIDEEVRRLIDEATEEARRLIEANREKVERLAKLLVEKETVFAEDIEVIFGRSASEERKAAESTEKADAAAEKSAESEAAATTEAVPTAEPAPEATDEPQGETAKEQGAE